MDEDKQQVLSAYLPSFIWIYLVFACRRIAFLHLRIPILSIRIDHEPNFSPSVPITFLRKHLHNACNILIALNAFGEIIHQFSHIPFAYFIFSGITFIPLRTCIRIQLLSNFCLNFAMATLFVIGVDRVFAVVCLSKYRHMEKKFYLPVMILPPLLYATTMVTLAFKFGGNSDSQVPCVVVAIYSGLSRTIWNISAFLINLSTVTLYAVLAQVVRKTGVSGSNARLLRSVRVVAACVGLGWLTTMLVNLMTFIPDITELTMFYTASYAGIFVNTSIACNWLIYYFNSSEYRYEFKKQLLKLPCLKNVVKVVPTTIQVSEAQATTKY